ncbi:MAG: tetratricopeptide repeat protein [Acidimicrobiales bacterium]
MSALDTWGEPVAAANPSSVIAWNDAWIDLLHFQGDPFARLAEANRSDAEFVLGLVFCVVYRSLAGKPPGFGDVRDELERAASRVATSRERGHVEAASLLVGGNFTRAGERWEELASDSHDLAAIRFAHEMYLHVGDAERRLRASTTALAGWSQEHPNWAFIAGQHSFALEEVGQYAQAEQVGWQALERDPLDLWALHALAHVYESTDNQPAALDLLRSRQPTWTTQDVFSVHIWWHLALRLMVDAEFDEVLAIHDRLAATVTTAFHYSDLASMLWRLELLGVDVGDRWDAVAEAYATLPERHTTGFLDLHAALAFARRPDHAEAPIFFAGVAPSHANDPSENGEIFRTVVVPMTEAIRLGDTDPRAARGLFTSIGPRLHRIGGSNAQRQVLSLTLEALGAT